MISKKSYSNIRNLESFLRQKPGDNKPIDFSEYANKIWYTFRYNRETKKMEYEFPDKQ